MMHVNQEALSLLDVEVRVVEWQRCGKAGPDGTSSSCGAVNRAVRNRTDSLWSGQDTLFRPTVRGDTSICAVPSEPPIRAAHDMAFVIEIIRICPGKCLNKFLEHIRVIMKHGHPDRKKGELQRNVDGAPGRK